MAMAVGRRWFLSREAIALQIAIGLITLALQAMTGGGVTWSAVGIALGAVVLAAILVPALAYAIAWYAAPQQMILGALIRIEEILGASAGEQVSPAVVAEGEPDRDAEARTEIARRAVIAFRRIQLDEGEREAF